MVIDGFKATCPNPPDGLGDKRETDGVEWFSHISDVGYAPSTSISGGRGTSAANLPWSEGPRRFTATMTDKKYVYDFLEGDASMRNLLGGKGANV
ncbi:MAG: hypothetical protein FWF25_06310, partial [Propionibacteriaceae bacterium]|nr:hypothetical protein [Propionibacteriaceae bacterium]